MKTKRHKFKSGLLALALLCSGGAYAQTDPVYIDGPYYITGQYAEFYGDFVLGPNAELYIEDGATVYFYGANFTIDPAAKIYGADNAWTNIQEGVGTGKIVFRQPNPIDNSVVKQTLNGSNGAGLGDNPSLMNLEIDNPSGVALTGSNTRITGDLTFTNGSLLLEGQQLELGPSATLTGYDNTKHVVTNGAGYLVKEGLADAASFTFPIGKADGDYTPATITNKGGAANDYFAQVMDYAASVPSENGLTGMDRAWNIHATNATLANISLTHNVSTNGSNYAEANAFLTQQTAANSWMQGPPVNTTGNPLNLGVANGASTQSRDFTLATTGSAHGSWFSSSSDAVNPLPLTLDMFTAKPVNGESLLEWATLTESNTSHFTVQHSINGSGWENIGNVKAAGQSNVRLAYHFIHTKPVTGYNYYRLLMADLDGRSSFSPIRQLSFKATGELTLMPNPATSQVKLMLPSALSNQGRVQVFSNAGQLVITQAASGAQVIDLEISRLPNGVYQVVVSDQGKILYNKQFIKQ
jgi:hypothetical protein